MISSGDLNTAILETFTATSQTKAEFVVCRSDRVVSGPGRQGRGPALRAGRLAPSDLLPLVARKQRGLTACRRPFRPRAGTERRVEGSRLRIPQEHST